MENVVLIIHLILALAIIGLVLIQRSEGGGLGIGGGSGGMGGLATPGGTASALTKMTAFFAACFFATSLTLAIMAGAHHKSSGILETYSSEAASSAVAGAEAEEGVGNDAEDADVGGDEVEGSDVTNDSESENNNTPVQKPSVPLGE